MAEEFGPWIEHDGKGCPCIGSYVRAQFSDGDEVEGIVQMFLPLTNHGQWDWAYADAQGIARIVAYSIRRPRALTQLIELVETLPAQPEEVSA